MAGRDRQVGLLVIGAIGVAMLSVPRDDMWMDLIQQTSLLSTTVENAPLLFLSLAVVGEGERSQTNHATGVGLWIANWVARNMGGELSFEANSPQGTVAVLRVPRVDVEQTP